MQVVKNNPAFDSPREKLKRYFTRGDLFFTRDSHLCFVCGAGGDTLPNSDEPSLRALFIRHIDQRGDQKIVCVRAETAATDLLRQPDERKTNISLFEKTIADTVDSVLIFPESPGSYAELGFFSAYEPISKKTLVAIKAEYQVGSFLTLGPIHSIARVSDFAPIPFSIAAPIEDQMPKIAARLLGDHQTRPYRDRLELLTWKDYDSRKQLAIIDEIVDIVGIITEVDLRYVIYEIFGAYDISKLRLQLSLLYATNRIDRNDDGDVIAKPRQNSFIEGAKDKISVRALWRIAYEQNDPDSIIVLDGAQSV